MLNQKKPMSQKQIGWLMEHKKESPNAMDKLKNAKAPKPPKFSGWMDKK